MSEHNHHHDISSNRIGVVFFLNFFFTIIEFIGGALTGSTAIMADAVHDLGDTLSIGLAWVLNKLSKKHSNDEFTYGYHRFSLVGALINGMVLIVGSIWVLSEAIPKLLVPEMPHAQGMFWLAILGVSVNGYAAWKISAGKTLNERVLNWHLMEDVLGWVSVLIVSILLLFFNWPILDPLLSIGFTLFILINVAKNIYQTIKIFLQSVPDEQMLDEIRQKLLSTDYIKAIHHLHLWSLDGERHVLTAHLEIDHMISANEQKHVKQQINLALTEFNLEHTTLELELPNEVCRDIPKTL
ncbi:Cobalt-zinc-cadmium resistance protein CzcD [hydrothermal vent metagenome]|uniref:Cobalt-zinc-cadmium resistance protein CzcD n=1 Tax=hydrothermal vent metagenome TaxID=652676 RepID=A0A3B0WJ29_9ZZZZ